VPRSADTAPATGDAAAAGVVNPLLPFTDEKPLIAYIDGGARGNRGPAGYGVRIETPTARSSTNSQTPSVLPPTTLPSTAA
jgi:hypothetical protein